MGTLKELFPDYTHEITEQEKVEVLHLVDVLRRYCMTRYRTGAELARIMYAEYLGAKIKASKMRKLINIVRRFDMVKGYVLISGQRGYKLSNDVSEITRYCESLSERRVAIEQVEIALRRQRTRLLHSRLANGGQQ